MPNIERLNIKINVKAGIDGIINSYKYNVNTDLKSKNSIIYTPIKYNLPTNASKIPKLKDVSLYSDRSRLEDFLKKTTSTKGDKDENIKFILKLLFKKNSKFYIKSWEFIVSETPEDKDITINSSNTVSKNEATLKKEALTKKHAEIREKITEPYKDLPKADYDYYEPTIRKQIIEVYNRFLANKVERDAYTRKYIVDHIDKLNQIIINLELKLSKQTAEYMNKHGFNVPAKYLPKFRDCKSRKKQMYEEFMELLCADLSDIPPTTQKTNKYIKNLNEARKISRKYVGHPSKDFPCCKKYNKGKIKRRKLTVSNLPNRPINLPVNTITRKTKMFF